MSGSVKIFEVGPRDGLQNEERLFSLDEKFKLIQILSKSGLSEIEAGAFVSPKWVQQMANSKELFQKISSELSESQVLFSALVPNERGMQDALTAGVKKVSVFTAASETFNQKNINTSIEGSLERFRPVLTLAKENNVAIRAYVSTAFVCPFEGEVKPELCFSVIEKLIAMGIQEISIGDTIGKATPRQVEDLMAMTLKKYPAEFFWMHFHDTYGDSFESGTAWPNIEKSLSLNLNQFDSSIAGLGGCPYAPGASGNVSTNLLVQKLHSLGYTTQLDEAVLTEAEAYIKNMV